MVDQPVIKLVGRLKDKSSKIIYIHKKGYTKQKDVKYEVFFLYIYIKTYIYIYLFPFLKLLNEFYHIYSCTMVMTAQFYSISIPNPQFILHPQPVLFRNHKFFEVCESISVMQRSSLCPFFRLHM